MGQQVSVECWLLTVLWNMGHGIVFTPVGKRCCKRHCAFWYPTHKTRMQWAVTGCARVLLINRSHQQKWSLRVSEGSMLSGWCCGGSLAQLPGAYLGWKHHWTFRARALDPCLVWEGGEKRKQVRGNQVENWRAFVGGSSCLRSCKFLGW